jgi:transmembrane sensor
MKASAGRNHDSTHRRAAQWAARLDRAGLEPAENRALEMWLAEDPGHRALLAEYCQLSADAERWLPQVFPQGATVPVAAAQPVRLRAWAAGLAAVLAVGLAAWLAWPSAGAGQVITTLPAQRHAVKLADGTRADLNARTTATVAFTTGERRLELRAGEVFLDVAPEAARPFVIVAPAGVVTVTGTQFNLRLAGPADLEVTVLAGAVQVRPGEPGGVATEHALRPGDQLTLKGRDATVRRLSAAAAADVTAWRDGTVVFERATLAEAARRYADYHGRRAEVDPAVAELTVGGRFALDDWDGFFAALERIVPVRAERRGEAVRLGPASP